VSEPLKPLSEKPLGYLLAFAGGTPGLPLGWLLSPLVLYGLNKLLPGSEQRQPNRFAWWSLIGIIGVPLCWLPWIVAASVATEQRITSCNNGNKESCRQLLTQEAVHSRISNPYLAQLKKEAEGIQKRNEQLAREQAQKALAAVEKRRFLDWAKSSDPFVGCQVELKNQLRDPQSYQDDFASPDPIINETQKTVGFVWRFRSRNGFGGYTGAAATCETKPDAAAAKWGGYGIASVSIVEE